MANSLVINVDLNTTGAISNLNVLGNSVSKTTGKASIDFESFTSKITATAFAFNSITDMARKVGNALSYPIQQFKEFQSAMANVESLGVENIDSLKKSVLSLGTDKNIPLGFKDISDGLYQVVSAGVDAENQINVLEVSAKAGVAGIASTTDSLNLASAVIKGYGKDWSETESILDQAFKTVKLGQTTFPELAGAIGSVVPLASALKIETKELFGAYATLTGVTGNTAEVSTQLKAIMDGLASPTAEMTKLIKSQGFESVETAVKAEGLAGILGFLEVATGGSATEMNKYFGRVEAVTAALALSTTQHDTFLNKTDEMLSSTGAMSEAFDVNSKTIENQAVILENKFNKKLIEAVDYVTPFITSLLEMGSTILDMDFTPLVIGIGTVGSAFVGLSISQYVAQFGGFIPALKFAGFAFQYFAVTATTAISSIPIVGWIAAGITALGALATALYLTSNDEMDLAEARKISAEKTIELIKQEKIRAEQLITSGTEIDKNRAKVEKLTESMIVQQKIIADAEKTKYKIEMEEAGSEISSSYIVALTDYQAKMDDLVLHHKSNYIAMQETVDRNLSSIISKLTDHETGVKKMSDSEIEKLTNSKETWLELSETINVAASAQKKYQESSNYLQELNTKKTTIEEKVIVEDDKTPGKDPSGGNTEDYYKKESLLLESKLQSDSISYANYYSEKSKLLDEQLKFSAGKYTDNSSEYYGVLAEKKKLDEDYFNNNKAGIDAQINILDLQYDAQLISTEEFYANKLNLLDEQIQNQLEKDGIYNEETLALIVEKNTIEEELAIEKRDKEAEARQAELDMIEFDYELGLMSDEAYYTKKEELLNKMIDATILAYGRDSKEAQALLKLKKKLNADEVKDEAQKTALEKQMRLDFAKTSIGTMSDIANMFAGQSHASFLVAKRFSQTETLINTYDAAQRAYASQLIPGDPTSLPRAYVAAGLATVKGLAHVAMIEAQSFATGGVITTPTLAIVGDAKKSGNDSNTEFILNTPQMKEVIQSTNNNNFQTVSIDYNLIKNAFLEAFEDTSIEVFGTWDMDNEKVFLSSRRGEQSFKKLALI